MCKNIMHQTLNNTYFDDIAYVEYCCCFSFSSLQLALCFFNVEAPPAFQFMFGTCTYKHT